MIKKKKGLSPVIATVLLIAIVVVIGTIIFLWFRGLSEETITKFGRRNIKLVCNDVKFDADYTNSILTLSNTADVPIYSMQMKISMPGGYVTKDFKEDAADLGLDWPETGLGQGHVFSADMTGLIDDSATEITLIPVLVGKTAKGSEKKYVCEERHGRRLLIQQ